MITINTDQIEALLPQTQCGLCGYGGCRPYAEAIAKQHEAINRCPPGGTTLLQKLGALLQQDTTPWLDEMQQKQKPFAVAKIREAECIGCTLCIKACPVDAIIGSGKMRHSVLRNECTGCELCVAPCPVNCIEMEILPARGYSPFKARERYYHRQYRLNLKAKATNKINGAASAPIKGKKAEILAAVARAKARRNNV